MSQSLSTLTTKIRHLLKDIAKTEKDVFTYNIDSVFPLSEENPIEITSVEVNGETSGVSYEFYIETGKIKITSSLSVGDTVKVIYTCYPNYSSGEIESAIRSSLMYISINNYYDFIIEEDDVIYPEPDERETNLIAIIASVILEPNNQNFSLPDIRITTSEKLSVDVKIRKMIGIFKKNSHGVFFIA